jgi:hypothetical protein
MIVEMANRKGDGVQVLPVGALIAAEFLSAKVATRKAQVLSTDEYIIIRAIQKFRQSHCVNSF